MQPIQTVPSDNSREDGCASEHSGELWPLLRKFTPGRLRYTSVAAALAALWFLAIPFSPPSGTDTTLAYASATPALDHLSLVHAYRHLSAQYLPAAVAAFPLARLPLFLWLLGMPIAAAKILQYLLVVATFVLLAVLVRKVTNSSRGAVLAVLGALVAWQFRTGPDPVLDTSLILPWAANLTLCAYISWACYRAERNAGWLLAACVFLAISMLSGPVGWALALVLVLWGLLEQSYRPQALWMAGVFGLITVFVTKLQAFVSWSGRGTSVVDVGRQMIAAIPTTYRAFQNLPVGKIPSLYHNGTHYVDDRFIFYPGPTIFDWIAIAACTLTAFLLLQNLRKNSPHAFSDAGPQLGAAFLIVPAFFFYRLQWPNGLHTGQSFDVVYYQYLGFGMLLSTAALWTFRARSAATKLLPAIATLAVLLVCYGNTRADEAVISRSARIDSERLQIVRAAGAGFFHLLPPQATLVLDPSMALAKLPSVTLRNMLYSVRHRTFRVTDLQTADKVNGDTWMLSSRDRNHIIALYHLVDYRHGNWRTDRAAAYSELPNIWHDISKSARGIVVGAASGTAIHVRRTCGDVPTQNAFAESRPTLKWETGFYHQGPVGYPAPPLQMTPLGDVATWPKMFMSHDATLRLTPSACAPAYTNLRAVAVGGGRGHLFITSPDGHVDVVSITQQPAVFWLRYDQHDGRPIEIHFRTDAPETDLDPVQFRYEHDVPRHLRLIIQPIDVWEDMGQPE